MLFMFMCLLLHNFCVFPQTDFLKKVSHETRAMRLKFELMWRVWLQLRRKQLLLNPAAVYLTT